ncbi:hypothetical protein M0D21_21905 [Aquimarina sp. D1M17]|uniref:hypothetical protein n=1 Tax=Aquimarina acroporae TaxID=2937283 RepID=UPI0020C11884|nr:hypothetical protein [Aquimarina acroporae]MCK8524249.1 hypothetical protein [Aquimarina acroporae]
MKNLNAKELIEINGGHDGVAYEAGVVIGNIIEVAITVVGIGKVAKWAKKLF